MTDAVHGLEQGQEGRLCDVDGVVGAQPVAARHAVDQPLVPVDQNVPGLGLTRATPCEEGSAS